MCVCVCVYMCVSVCVYIYIYIYIYTFLITYMQSQKCIFTLLLLEHRRICLEILKEIKPPTLILCYEMILRSLVGQMENLILL